MIVQKTDRYIKACMQAWLFCESCIHSEISSPEPRTDLVKECHECAQACFAVVCKLVSNHQDVHDLAFDCIFHCRACEQICQQFWYVDDIKFCGDVCGECAERVKDILFPAYFLN